MILNDILRTRDVYIITGYTDLRKSIDGLAIKALESFGLNPLEMKDAAFMYCGKNTITAYFVKIGLDNTIMYRAYFS